MLGQKACTRIHRTACGEWHHNRNWLERIVWAGGARGACCEEGKRDCKKKRSAMEEPDHRHRRLLRLRRERPRRCRAAKQHDELPPSPAGHGLPLQVCRTISLPSTSWQVPVADLNSSEFRGLPLWMEMTPIWGICK